MKRPEWCPNKDCEFSKQSQDMICRGKLPESIPHGDGFNTDRICLDTRETGHGIFDLQVNEGDLWNMIRIFSK